MEDVIIDFSANVEGLKPVISYLRSIGQITDEQVKDFEKMNKLYSERTKKIAEERTQIKGASKDLNDLAKSAQYVNKAISGAGISEATAKVVEHGKEVVEVTKKYASAKQELIELTKQITSGDLSGEQLEIAKLRAAELTDNIADARGEISAMASDTRKFDLVVEGVRGVTAAFSVAQGVAALFGKENEDVQQALLKVQAAMALATGAQELANIATTKGGIVSKSYAIALEFVEKVQERLRISSVATWAAITGGIAIAGAAIYSLIQYYNDGDNTVEAFNKKRDEEEKIRRENELKMKEEQIASLSEKDKEFFDSQESERKRRIASGEKDNQVEFDLLSKSIERFQNKILAYKSGNYDYLGLSLDEEKNRISQLEDYVNDAIIKRNRILQQSEEKRISKAKDNGKREAEAIIDNGKREAEAIIEGLKSYFLKDKEVDFEIKKININPSEVVIEKVPEIPFKPIIPKKDLDNFIIEMNQVIQDNMEVVQFMSESANQIISGAFENLQQERENDLDHTLSFLQRKRDIELRDKSLTEAEKDAINEKYRKKEAEAKRNAWIADQKAKADQALINGLLAFTMSLATQGFPAGAITGALAVAASIVESGLIMSKPVPAFEKGGKNIPSGMKLVGEKGPELIWTPGGETVIPHADTAKILEAWSIPMANLPNDLKGNNAIGYGMPGGIDYKIMAKSFSEELRNNPSINVQLDGNGFGIHIIEKGRKISLLNSKYDA